MNEAKHYRTLILGGYGGMGQALLLLGAPFIASFDRVLVLEREQVEPAVPVDALFLRGDIEDVSFLSEVLHKNGGPSLLVNLCSSTDTYHIRKVVSRYGGAYLDTSCSVIRGVDEHRYSRLMPHTFRPTMNRAPHFTCCGVNPGVVEIIARKIIRDTFPKARRFDILFFENDQFHVPLDGGRVGVSWSAETLVDEVMLTPTFYIKEGRPVELDSPPTLTVGTRWGDRHHDARLVGHEEIWNLQRVEKILVDNSFFSYAFHDAVTNVLQGDANRAHGSLMRPGDAIPVSGTDTLAVRVVEKSSGNQRTLVWTTDHAAMWRRWGINGVQFQVASSLLFFLDLLLRSGDWSTGRLWCGSDMPLERFGWDVVDGLLDTYGIEWKEANGLDLCVEEGPFAGDG